MGGNSPKRYDELQRMSDDELMAGYNAEARHTALGMRFYRDELWRREVARAQDAATEATETTKSLTWAISGLTLVNVVLVALQVAA